MRAPFPSVRELYPCGLAPDKNGDPPRSLHAFRPAGRCDGVTPPCPSCAASGCYRLRSGIPDRFHPELRYQIFRCPRCRLRFTHPVEESYPDTYEQYSAGSLSRTRRRPTRDAILRVFYRAGGSWLEKVLLLLPYVFFRARDKMKMKARDVYAHPFRRRGALLDIGCGNGGNLVLWSPQQVSCVGVEPHRPTAEAARRTRKLDIRPGRLEEQSFPPQSFDVITLSHVLEHVARPLDELRRVAALLRPGGEVLIWVPNYAGLLRRFFGDAWFPYEIPRHLWHFQADDLCSLLHQAGLRPVEISCDANEWCFRQGVKRLPSRLLRTLLARRSARILAMLACRLFRRADILRIRAVPQAAATGRSTS